MVKRAITNFIKYNYKKRMIKIIIMNLYYLQNGEE